MGGVCAKAINNMGIYSTIFVTREYAIKEILEHIAMASDRDLAEVLFDLKKDKVLYNYIIDDDEARRQNEFENI